MNICYFAGLCPNCNHCQGQYCKSLNTTSFNCKKCGKRKKIYNAKMERQVKVIYYGCNAEEAKLYIQEHKSLNSKEYLQ